MNLRPAWLQVMDSHATAVVPLKLSGKFRRHACDKKKLTCTSSKNCGTPHVRQEPNISSRLLILWRHQRRNVTIDGGQLNMLSFLTNYLFFIFYIFSLSIINNNFYIFFVASVVADYLDDRVVEGGTFSI